MSSSESKVVDGVVWDCERMKVDFADPKVFARLNLFDAILQRASAFSPLVVAGIERLRRRLPDAARSPSRSVLHQPAHGFRRQRSKPHCQLIRCPERLVSFLDLLNAQLKEVEGKLYHLT